MKGDCFKPLTYNHDLYLITIWGNVFDKHNVL